MSGCPYESVFANLMIHFNKNVPSPQCSNVKRTISLHAENFHNTNFDDFFCSFCRCIVNFPGQAWTLHRCYFWKYTHWTCRENIVCDSIPGTFSETKYLLNVYWKGHDQNNRLHLVNKYQLFINRDAFTIRVESLFTWFSFWFFFSDGHGWQNAVVPSWTGEPHF